MPDKVQGWQNGREILGGSDETDVVRALVLQPQEDIRQFPYRQCFAESFMADFIILAVAAAQGTAGEENRAAAAGSADTWLFPGVKHRQGGHGLAAAPAAACSLGSVNAAFLGAEFAMPEHVRADIQVFFGVMFHFFKSISRFL